MAADVSGIKCAVIQMNKTTFTFLFVPFFSSLFQEGAFNTRCLREFWQMVVPVNFCPVPGHNCMESLYDEAQVVREMILPLEQFLCGSPTVDPEMTILPLCAVESFAWANRPTGDELV